LGIGDWAQSPIPNPQSPIPNPQSPKDINLNLYISIIILNQIKKNKLLILKIKKCFSKNLI